MDENLGLKKSIADEKTPTITSENVILSSVKERVAKEKW